MTTEEKIKGLEHLLRKCPDVITALQASRLIHVSKNSIHAAINEGKLIAYAYRGKRLISSRLYRLPRRHHRRRNRMAEASAGEDKP